MAEYREVVKQFKRICEHYRQDDVCCANCPLKEVRGIYHCWKWISEEPEKAEELIMNWAEEHPEKTNGDIFKDTYGFDIEYLFLLTDGKGREEWAKQVYKEDRNG